MKIIIKAYGIARDMVGGATTEIEIKGQQVGALRSALVTKYPDLKGLRSLMIAVNQRYATDTQDLNEADEIVLIPPVSGG